MVRDMLSIAAILLAAACLVYTALKRDRSVTTYALCAALAATSALEAFDLLSLLYPADFFFWKKAALLSEALLPPTWLLFSLTFSRRVEPNSLSLLQRTLAGLSPVFLAAALFITTREFFNSPDFPAERMLFLGDPGFAFYLGILIYMTASLVNLENTLLTTSRAARWSIKFEVLGAGALIAVLIFYYSQGLLYRSINMDLIPVRSIVMIVAAAFMAYSVLKRGKGIKAKVYVSKQMAYRSVVVFIVGLYLIGLGLIGEGMRYFGGGSAQKVMLISIGFISGIGLVVLLLSETVKRKIKVVLHKNFYTNKYDYRVQWLQFTDRLSCSKTGEDLLKAILAGFCDTFGMGGAMLFLREGGKGALRHAVSFETDPVDRVFSGDSALVRFMKTKRRIFYAKDHTPEVMKEDGDFFREYGISFAVPLYVNDEVEGFIALGRSINKKELYTYEDYDLMRTFAQHASSAILNLRLSDELAEAREMEALGKISAFVIHDLKNLVSTISLIVDNAESYMGDSDFQKDMLQSLGNTIGKMKRLITRLRNFEEKQVLNRSLADLHWIVYDVVALVGAGEVKVQTRSVFSEVDAEEIQKVVLNLVLNAIEATGGKGPVTVEVGGDETAFIRVRDCGCGMTEEFMRMRLFKPFHTTKAKGLGIGLYQCKQIIEAHGGRIEVSSEAGRGSTFTVHLPAAKEADCTVQCNA